MTIHDSPFTIHAVESRVTRHESRAVVETALSLPLYMRGKVRDVYAVEGHLLLIVATDRLSAFDCVLPTPIPDKGQILTQLSAFWFKHTADIIANHLVTADIREIVQQVPQVAESREVLAGRAMLVRRCERIDVECVVRGHITGSAWDEYRRVRAVAGVRLHEGLRNGDQLREPIFTPATKASTGHDQNITFPRMAELVGGVTAEALRKISLALYERAAQHARHCGLVLADTKFEFGRLNGQITLIDEALTPDSSRYWDAAAYPQSLVAFDKQFVRDYLNEIGWKHDPPAPPLPPEVVEATRERYLETYRRITGNDLAASLPSSRA